MKAYDLNLRGKVELGGEDGWVFSRSQEVESKRKRTIQHVITITGTPSSNCPSVDQGDISVFETDFCRSTIVEGYGE